MFIEYSPKERASRIIELLAEGVIGLIGNTSYSRIGFITSNDLRTSSISQIKPEDILLTFNVSSKQIQQVTIGN